MDAVKCHFVTTSLNLGYLTLRFTDDKLEDAAIVIPNTSTVDEVGPDKYYFLTLDELRAIKTLIDNHIGEAKS